MIPKVDGGWSSGWRDVGENILSEIMVRTKLCGLNLVRKGTWFTISSYYCIVSWNILHSTLFEIGSFPSVFSEIFTEL